MSEFNTSIVEIINIELGALPEKYRDFYDVRARYYELVEELFKDNIEDEIICPDDIITQTKDDW